MSNTTLAWSHGEVEPRPVLTKAPVTTVPTATGSSVTPGVTLTVGYDLVLPPINPAVGGRPLSGTVLTPLIPSIAAPVPLGIEAAGAVVGEIKDFLCVTFKVAYIMASCSATPPTGLTSATVVPTFRY